MSSNDILRFEYDCDENGLLEIVAEYEITPDGVYVIDMEFYKEHPFQISKYQYDMYHDIAQEYIENYYENIFPKVS